MKKYAVTLAKDERDNLKAITSKGSHKSQKIINALILMGWDKGELQEERSTNEEIARVLKIGMRKIDRVKKRFVEHGIDITLTGMKGSRTYAKKVDGDFEAHLIALSCNDPPEGFARHYADAEKITLEMDNLNPHTSELELLTTLKELVS